MAWGKAGSTDVTSGDALTLSSVLDSKFYTFLYLSVPSGEMTEYQTVGNGTKDTGNRYANRKGKNGAEGTFSSRANWVVSAKSGATQPELGVGYIFNIAGEEKLMNSRHINANASGAGSIPDRQENAGKWANTSDVMDVISFDNTGTGDYATGTNLSALGSDLTPAGTVPAVPAVDNVQDNSIFVETDTARRYWLEPEVPSTSASTATTENDNGVNEQVMSSANFEFIGEKVVNTSSALYGLDVNKIGFMMKKREGSPTGTATACVMDGNADILYTFGTVDVSTLPSTYTWTYFTNTVSTYTLTNGNYIGIKYSGGDASNRIGVYWDNGANYDGTNSIGSEESGGAWNDRSTQDFRFKIFTGTASIPATWTRGYFNARGVFCGGYNGSNVDVIDYITIATLGNATDFGDMSVSRRALGSVANDTRGVFCGGYSTGYSNVMDYITIATLGNSTDFGDSTTSYRSGVVGAGSDTRGLFAGGESPKVNIIDYITIATLGNATDFGNLTVARKGGGATSDKTKAVFLGGESGETTMDYVTIATLANAVSFGTMSAGSYGGHCGTISNGTRGVFAIGGSTASGGYNNTIIYITIATPANATVFGDLTQGRADGGQAGDSTRGVFAGGKTSSGSSNVATTIDYITISTLGNATDFGDLTAARNLTTGLSDGQ